jgi:opacity protein-like surface antigen
LFIAMLSVAVCQAQSLPSVRVADPYISLRSGPGEGYPVFHTAERGAWLEVISRRNFWYQVRTERAVDGWIHQDALLRTLDSAGHRIELPQPDNDNYSRRYWELGYLAGEFDGGTLMGLSALWHPLGKLALEAQYSAIDGSFSKTRNWSLSLIHLPKPDWVLTPYLVLGAGRAEIQPQTIVMQSEAGSRSETLLSAGLGLRWHFAERFALKAEYRHNRLQTNRSDNPEIDEWKAGFSVFF